MRWLAKLGTSIDRKVEKHYNKFSLLSKKEGIGIRQQTCCILGNRLLPRRQADEIAARLEEKILKLHALGVTRFFTGGGLGFDTLAAQVVLRVSEAHPSVRLVLVLPCRDQAAKWPAAAIATYESIKSQASEIIYTAETISRGHILKRNRYMVDESDYVLTHLSKTSGRTAQTIRYAEKTDHVIINVAKETQGEGTLGETLFLEKKRVSPRPPS